MAVLALAWYDWIGLLGTLMILGAFFWLQTGRVSGTGLGYQLVNLLGAGGVLVSLVGRFNLAVFLLEGAWVAISAYGIWRTLRFRGVRDFPALGDNPPPARVRLKVRVSGNAAVLPTVAGVFPNAGWSERELFDLFGLVFEGHPDLRRILLPDDWEGHPLRKDYPVQVKVPVKTHEMLQVTQEEFVSNIERQRRVLGQKPRGGTGARW